MAEFDIVWSNRHDIWNIIWLPIIVIININLLATWSTFIEYLFTYVFLLYLGTDFIWLLIKPSSVTSPKVILFHHIVTIIGISTIPYVDHEMKKIICTASLVELNTWIRLLKNLYKEYILFDMLFIISWIVIRCIIGPLMLVTIAQRCEKDMSWINIMLTLISLILNCLSVIWTFTLVKTIKKRYFDTKNHST